MSRNGGDGIFVGDAPVDAAESVITGNMSSRNEDDGIDVETPAGRLGSNRIDRNGDLGIEAVAGIIDLGRNGAFRNGNPLECLNVFCR